jgi:DNA-binding NarL/FixJ family response regulator
MADSLEHATDMEVAFQAGSCAEARARFRPGQADVVAIEVEQPDGNGATLALTLQRADERLSVVLVTGHDVRAIVESTRQHLRRPWSYVSKKADVSAADLVQALRRAALAPDQAPPAIESGGPQADPFKGLTAQQLAVLRLISEGFTNTQVADRLGLSRRTVENHLLGIYRIFEIGSDDVNPRVTAVLRFLSHTIKY